MHRTPRTKRTNCFFLHLLMAGFATAAAPSLSQGWQVIHEDSKLLASDGAVDEEFGHSIAIADGVVAVGARFDDDNMSRSGSAYTFNAFTGAPLAKLLPNDGAANNEFGWSIAIDNGIVAVGARYDNDNGRWSGSAYLFDASTGAQLHKLLPRDGTARDRFGWSIAIDDGIVAVGAVFEDAKGDKSGSAYVFNASTGAQIAKLVAGDGVANDWFGYSIAISNGIVAVGSPFDDDNFMSSGSAYLFDAATGTQLAKLTADDGAAFDHFGISIAIDQGIVAIGANLDEDNGADAGSAYLFDTDTGTQLFKLLPNDGDVLDLFGVSIAISNGIVAVGAERDDDNGIVSGSAYFFDANTGVQITKLLPRDGAEADFFGTAIAIANGIAAVGAVYDDDNGSNSGSAYLFSTDFTPSCLELTVENLVAGQQATFTITGGVPGSKAVTVYGTQPGQTSVSNYAGYCATFAIDGVFHQKVIGGFNRTFDNNGKITFNLNIPANAAGLGILFQTAEQNTCPDECMSNRVGAVVQ